VQVVVAVVHDEERIAPRAPETRRQVRAHAPAFAERLAPDHELIDGARARERIELLQAGRS